MPGEPHAAAMARRWLAEILEGWPEPQVETTRLLVSEVVTNAVLHACSDVEVRVRMHDRGVRVEVADRLPSAPLPKPYRPDAATGRGLRLLATLAERWGVSPSPDGKTVWFEVGRDAGSTGTRPERPDDVSGDGALQGDGAGADDETLAGSAEQPARSGRPDGGRRGGAVEVCIEQIPVALYLEAEQHNDAVMREFALIAQAAGSSGGGRVVPRRLLELGEEVRSAFKGAVPELRLQVDEAIRQGSSTVDLRLRATVAGWRAFLRLARQLDEADRYCQEGDLLTLVSSPEVRRFRRWYAGQVASQVAGRPTGALPGQGPADQGSRSAP